MAFNWSNLLMGLGETATDTASALAKKKQDEEDALYKSLAMRKLGIETSAAEEQLAKDKRISDYIQANPSLFDLEQPTSTALEVPAVPTVPTITPPAPAPSALTPPAVSTKIPQDIQQKYLSPEITRGIQDTIAGGKPSPMEALENLNKGYKPLTTMLATSTSPGATKIGEWATGIKKEKMAEASREAAREGVSQFWNKWNKQPSDLDAMEQDLSLLKSNLGESKDLESLNAVDTFIKNKRAQENAATMAGQKTDTQKRLEGIKEEDALSKFLTQEMPIYRRGTQEGKAKGGFDAASKTINELNKGNINGYELQDIQNTLNIVENTGALNRTIGELLSKLGDPKDLLNEKQITALKKVAENDLRASSNILGKFFNTVRKSKAADFAKYPNQAQAFEELTQQYTAPVVGGVEGNIPEFIRDPKTGKLVLKQ